MPDLPHPRPFPRAVTERIAIGYVNMTEAVFANDPEIIIQNHKSGFSGNMCEILSDIYKLLEGRDLSHGMIWASELPPPKHLAVTPKQVRIDRKAYEILRAASESLQTVEEPEQDKTIIGRITRLRSEQPPLNTQEFAMALRTIVLLWEMEKQQPLHIHVELSLDQYREACDAHKNGKRVKIMGKPKKMGKFWNLTDHHDFEIIE